MQITQEIGFRDYGVYVQSGAKYTEVKQKMRSLMEFGLNSKMVEPLDILKFEMSETFVEAKQIFEDAYLRVQQVAAEQRQQDAQNQQALKQQQMQYQKQMADEAAGREAKVNIDTIQAQTQSQMMIDDNKSKNKLVHDQHNAENKFLQS